MNVRKTALTVAVLLIGTMCFAQNPNLGTWKLNEAKSKLAAGFPKNTTVVYETAGDSIKGTVDGVDAQGKPTHSVWVGKFDGKDYPLTGDPDADTRSYKKIDARTMELTNKKDGKVVVNAKIVVSAGGKTRTVTLTAAGKKVHSTAVYDKA